MGKRKSKEKSKKETESGVNLLSRKEDVSADPSRILDLAASFWDAERSYPTERRA